MDEGKQMEELAEYVVGTPITPPITNIAFTIPGEPQGKGRARVGRVGGFVRMFTPDKTLAYEGLVSVLAKQAMQNSPPFVGACFADVIIFHSIPASFSKKKTASALAGELIPIKKPDVDNVLKAVFDGMNGIVWRDDTQAVKVRAEKKYSATPGVFVSVAVI